MTSHPAVRDAGMALLQGIGPRDYLAVSDETERIIVNAVVNESRRIWAEDKQRETEAVAKHVANALARIFKKMFG